MLRNYRNCIKRRAIEIKTLGRQLSKVFVLFIVVAIKSLPVCAMQDGGRRVPPLKILAARVAMRNSLNLEIPELAPHIRRLMSVEAFISQHGATLEDALVTAIVEDNPVMVLWLIDRMGDINSIELLCENFNINKTDIKIVSTPLSVAVTSQHCRVVDLLCNLNADVNEINEWGNHILFESICSGARDDIIFVLLEHGADANATNKRGIPVLCEAASRKRINVVRALISHGANPTIADNNGQTPSQIIQSKMRATRPWHFKRRAKYLRLVKFLQWAEREYGSEHYTLACATLRDGADFSEELLETVNALGNCRIT